MKISLTSVDPLFPCIGLEIEKLTAHFGSTAKPSSHFVAGVITDCDCERVAEGEFARVRDYHSLSALRL